MGLLDYLRGKPGITGFGSASTAEEVTEGLDLSGKVVIVTGAGSGIGEETARVLAIRGAHVFMAVRNEALVEPVKVAILSSNPNAKVDALHLDLSSFKSVRDAASIFLAQNLPLHVIINNAGVMACPFSLSTNGHELQFATNHLGHFLFNNLLLEKMKATAKECGEEGRIVVVASEAHRFTYKEGIRLSRIDDDVGYWSWGAYGQSKLANILFAKELARRLQAEGAPVVVNALHPGAIKTPLQRHMSSTLFGVVHATTGALWKSIPQGAATQCFLATSPKVTGVTGKYFCDCNIAEGSTYSNDMELAARLWDFSERAVSTVVE